MKGSVILAESKSILTHMPASLVTSVSRQAIRQPKVITLMTRSRISVTLELGLRLGLGLGLGVGLGIGLGLGIGARSGLGLRLDLAERARLTTDLRCVMVCTLALGLTLF